MKNLWVGKTQITEAVASVQTIEKVGQPQINFLNIPGSLNKKQTKTKKFIYTKNVKALKTLVFKAFLSASSELNLYRIPIRRRALSSKDLPSFFKVSQRVDKPIDTLNQGCSLGYFLIKKNIWWNDNKNAKDY